MTEKNKEEINLGKNIKLIGFRNLDSSEMIIVKKIVGNYIKKIEEKLDYREIKIRMKQSINIKDYKHEIEIQLINKKSFNSKVTERNLYAALSKALEKILNQIEKC